MKLLDFFRDAQKRSNFTVWMLILLIIGVVILGVMSADDSLHMDVVDGVQQVDLDTIYLKSSGVEVEFSDVIKS